MDLSAFTFAFVMFLLGAWLTYQWGIKPDRETRKRKVEDLNAQLRRANRNASPSRPPGVTSRPQPPVT